MEKQKLERLESLDALRGFDLFCLVGIEVFILPCPATERMPISYRYTAALKKDFFYCGYSG